jgi:arsenate reductase
LFVYGLKNCDTCRKARKWLESEAIPHTFCDLRADPASRQDIARWIATVGADVVVNKRGTTWRGLTDAQKIDSSDDDYIDLLVEYPAIIKRPVFDVGDRILVGFTDSTRAELGELARSI